MAGQLAVAIAQAETQTRWQLLGGHDRTIDVKFTFHPAPAHNIAGVSSKGTLERVVDYYRQLQPQRMVITGAGGSGKTVLAVELILGLLKNRALDAPVPLRMSAASLDTSRPLEIAVADWVTSYLRQAYGLPEIAARQLVAARMILPVLDGLDEMDALETPGYASRAGHVIRACNAYLDGRQKAAIVLTCRISIYEALEQAGEWVRDAARVQLSPVGIAAARSFLAQRADDQDRWEPVLSRIRQSGHRALAQALSTPWRLALAAAVYDERDPTTGHYLRDPSDLTRAVLDTEDKIRDHLLSLFIPATAHGHRYPAFRVQQWLGVLARYLDANTPAPDRPARIIAGRTLSGADLVLHELWPIAGRRAPRVVTVGIIAALCAVLGVFVIVAGQYRLTPLQFLGVILLSIVAGGIGTMTWIAWPRTDMFDLRRLRTSSGRHSLVLWLVLGLVGGFVAGLIGGDRLVLGLVGALVGGLAGGLVPVLSADPEECSFVEPRLVPWANLVGEFVPGIVLGIFGGILDGFMFGLVGFLGGILAGGFIAGFGGWRYIAFLLCTRRWSNHWLPWRLGSFLRWSYEAGLIRIAGIGYQFRHKELQDYLARKHYLAP